MQYVESSHKESASFQDLCNFPPTFSSTSVELSSLSLSQNRLEWILSPRLQLRGRGCVEYRTGLRLNPISGFRAGGVSI